MHRVSPGSKGRARPSSVGSVARVLAVDHVRGYGQNGHCGNTFTVGVVTFDFVHKCLYEPNRKLVHPVVVVAVLGVVALYLEVGYYPLFVPYGVNVCVFDCRKRIRRARQPSDARCEKSSYRGIVQGHFQSFVAILVVHIVDKVQGVNVQSCKPVHHLLIFTFNIVEVKFIIAVYSFEARRYLHCLAVLILDNFVLTAVDCVKKAFCKVCACAEELHILADAHTAYATGDTVIVAKLGAHQIIAFVLDCRGGYRQVGAEFFEVCGKAFAPKHG